MLKKIEKFKPEFILLSAGFDAHKDDPLAQFRLESKDFYVITKKLWSCLNYIVMEKLFQF